MRLAPESPLPPVPADFARRSLWERLPRDGPLPRDTLGTSGTCQPRWNGAGQGAIWPAGGGRVQKAAGASCRRGKEWTTKY
jgi:hypothetical protein